ncbi:MAG: hypothetical protein KI792_12695 [Alphaproteobacteria bacterium]|nr:hypothetical protein [Alphaproteobacteria bacterium SS10]
MPKLDLSRAARIKHSSGELTALKGVGFSWVRPSTSFNPEAGLGAIAVTRAPGQFDLTPPANGREQMVLAFDLTLPATPPTANLIFEQGGGGRGIMLGCRGAFMRFRFGTGGSNGNITTGGAVGGFHTNNTVCMFEVPVTDLPFDGMPHTIVWQVDPRPGQIKSIGWVDGVEIFNFQPSGAVQSNQWGGGASGGFLTHTTNIQGETAYDNPWPVQTGECRVYLNQEVIT